MSRSDSRWFKPVDADALLDDLSTRQHLHPHCPLGQLLDEAQSDLGFCPEAGRWAIQWLQLDAGKAAGRLRRGELIQLARSIHRFWRQSLTLQASPS